MNFYHVAHTDMRVWKRMTPGLRLEVHVLVAVYGAALALTLAMSTADVSLSAKFNEDDFTWEQKFNPTGFTSLKTWRACCWARFVLAGVGWLISLARFDQVMLQLHTARRELDALRGAVRVASKKMIAQAKALEVEKSLHLRPEKTGTEA